MGVDLTRSQQAMLHGDQGQGVAMAMRVVLAACRGLGATRLIEITSAHIDSCLYHGEVSLDFARALGRGGARVRVPTTLNVGSVDLLHPASILRRNAEEQRVYRDGRELMELYSGLGCAPTWTCAPYQLPVRPKLGDHIAWAESNAVVFANSVLGARTERYGDFIDICSAITGLAPEAGLHTDAGRQGGDVFDCTSLQADTLENELTYALLGYLVGSRTTHGNPVILGLPPTTTEDRLKALGAAAASAGGIALFHAVGLTPEAPDLEAVSSPGSRGTRSNVTVADLESARSALMTEPAGPLDAVSIGTPHASLREMRTLAEALESSAAFHPSVEFFVSTGRHVLAAAEADGIVEVLEARGVRIVVDTCTYVTSILAPTTRTVMTNSAKWAHYAPANLGVGVAIGTLQECVESAVRGQVTTRPLGSSAS